MTKTNLRLEKLEVEALVAFIRDALERGVTFQEIKALLHKRGKSETRILKAVYKVLAAVEAQVDPQADPQADPKKLPLPRAPTNVTPISQASASKKPSSVNQWLVLEAKPEAVELEKYRRRVARTARR